MPKKKRLPIRSAGPDDPIYKEGLTVFTPFSARPKVRVAELGEIGQSGGAIITGANLRKRPEPKEPPKEEPEKGEKPDEG